jgi:hypothetical protein
MTSYEMLLSVSVSHSNKLVLFDKIDINTISLNYLILDICNHLSVTFYCLLSCACLFEQSNCFDWIHICYILSLIEI